MRATGWRPHSSGTLQGFFDLDLPSGLTIRDCTLHEKGERRWIGLPGRPQIEDGRHRTDPATGKPAYVPVVEIRDRERRATFIKHALIALDRIVRL
jgi:hypothetical protein